MVLPSVKVTVVEVSESGNPFKTKEAAIEIPETVDAVPDVEVTVPKELDSV